MSNPVSKHFFGINYIDVADADALVLPLPYEKTVSYGKGASGGPGAILEASLQLEFFDEETCTDFRKAPKLHTLPPLSGDGFQTVPDYLKAVENYLAELRDYFILGLGGEHTVTYGLVKGLARNLADTTVIQIDAHADSADELNGLKWSHGTVMRRLWDEGCRLIQIGIRSLSRPEYELVESGQRITTFFAHRLEEQWADVLRTLRELKGAAYLTIDVDGLDPSIIPSTGTPQPGGLNWRQTMELIRTVAASPGIRWLGADVVEFVPSPNPPGCDPAAARLAEKVLAWRHWGKQQ